MTQAERVKSAAIKLLRNEMEALRFRAVSKFAVYLGVGEKTLRRVFSGHTSLDKVLEMLEKSGVPVTLLVLNENLATMFSHAALDARKVQLGPLTTYREG